MSGRPSGRPPERPSVRPLVVWAAGVPWDAVPGTDHHLVRRLARDVDVWWVDPPVSVLRTARRTAGAGPRWRSAAAPVADGVTRTSVVSPPFPSRPGGRVAARLVSELAVRRALARDGRTPLAVVTARPEDHLAGVPTRCRVHYATDDFVAGAALLGLDPRRLARAERRSLAAADLAVAVSPEILDRWPWSMPTLLLPNGCDSERYRPVPVPDGGQSGGEAVAGVVGQLSARIDLALLEAVARRGRPLLLVGPADRSVDRARFDALVALPHVTWTGRQPAEALPDLLGRMKVGLTPYTDTPFNRASFPLKTLEYLAAGRAVVSTPLPAVAALGSPAVTTAADPGDFADAVDRALHAPDDEATVAARKAFAARHDWSRRARDLLEAIDAVVSHGPADR
ncbi:glycosyltransferase [Nocardioides alkalitolerans]|uniref:glycosyltransferase n=1 Tax=Nocardioides alkalitolerans TaxID=281714 RepID=UPI0012FAECF4|nr:glycosyltransferase [Nocardioides alkalitolerans]